MSRTFHLNKLARDGVVARMELEGQKPDFYTLTEPERPKKKREKIIEEALEIDPVDLFALAVSIARDQGMTYDELYEAHLKKEARVGGFENGIFIRSVTLEDNDPWVGYYAAEPERFPEETT